ncbi:hypothetical protein INS49_000316 [Diaporthe citri]|uniref:uncharacterized protein n=1 Tax=Diaporthe citri TaxID=83186 RepID=UPI001C7FD765|nr:uncharacterized protein INS49_000316 [Diaporthe citri]KAG6366140.1 hypothetical protein INS49_000316 [Diaporthe citri]
MAPREAPVAGSLRPFDPTAYTSKAKAAKVEASPSDPTTDAKADVSANVQTSTGGKPSLEPQGYPGGLKPAADTASVEASPSARNTEPPPAGSSALAEKPPTDGTGTQRLVSLRLIKKIYKAEVDDKQYSFAEIDGWTCKIPPRQYREGELVLYFQIDSFLPGTDDRFGKGFGKARKLQMLDGKLGQRIKTERFGSGEDKIVSQGMVMPVQAFPEIWKKLEVVRQFISIGPMERNVELINLTLLVMYRDRNWAEVLGVKKWEETAAQQKQPEHRRLGSYPGEVLRRTDVPRVEDCPNLFTKHKYNRLVYQESVKMDGAAMVVYFVKKSCAHFDSLNPLPDKVGPNTVLEGAQGARFGVCSNKVEKNELEEQGPGGFQGELCGDMIQRNREGLPEGEQDFFVFAMFDIDKQEFIDPRDVEMIAKELGLKHVPVLGYVKLTDIASSHQELKRRAAQRKGEGLVFKCLEDGRRFKVISHTYLLEHGI